MDQPFWKVPNKALALSLFLFLKTKPRAANAAARICAGAGGRVIMKSAIVSAGAGFGGAGASSFSASSTDESSEPSSPLRHASRSIDFIAASHPCGSPPQMLDFTSDFTSDFMAHTRAYTTPHFRFFKLFFFSLIVLVSFSWRRTLYLITCTMVKILKSALYRGTYM